MGSRSYVSINATVASIDALKSQVSADQGGADFVTGLLTDLRHYCDAYELDFAALDHRAYEHYCREKTEAEAQPVEDLRHRAPVYLSIPLRAWEDVSRARNRSMLAAQVVIEGVPHSVLAMQMEDAEQMRTNLYARRAAAGKQQLPKEPFRTARIFGRDYVLDVTTLLF
jgi:hypothetical protein